MVTLGAAWNCKLPNYCTNNPTLPSVCYILTSYILVKIPFSMQSWIGKFMHSRRSLRSGHTDLCMNAYNYPRMYTPILYFLCDWHMPSCHISTHVVRPDGSTPLTSWYLSFDRRNMLGASTAPYTSTTATTATCILSGLLGSSAVGFLQKRS